MQSRKRLTGSSRIERKRKRKLMDERKGGEIELINPG